MMELKTLRDMIAAVYGGLYAEDCAMVDREWARMRGYILPTDGRSALRPAPVQAGAMHPEQQRIAAESNARQAGADAAGFDIEQARRDLIKDQQDLIDTQQKRIKAIRGALERCIEELAESLENEGRLASFKAAIEKGRAALAFPPLADHAEPSVVFMFQAAERANKRFGKWMPQQWLEIFIDEMVGRS
jgi:hypothetical protein